MTIQLDTATLIYLASSIAVIAAAVKVLLSAKKALLKPLDDINNKLKSHDDFLANDKNKLDKIDYILADLVDAVNLLIEVTKTSLEHQEDGNHTGEIKEAIEEIDKWLLSRNRYQKGD